MSPSSWFIIGKRPWADNLFFPASGELIGARMQRSAPIFCDGGRAWCWAAILVTLGGVMVEGVDAWVHRYFCRINQIGEPGAGGRRSGKVGCC